MGLKWKSTGDDLVKASFREFPLKDSWIGETHELRNEVVEELILGRVSESGTELDPLLVSRGKARGMESKKGRR